MSKAIRERVSLMRKRAVTGSAGVSPAAPPQAVDMSDVEMEWRSRGYLPHCDGSGLIQSVNYRLFDSLPLAVLEALSRRFPSSEADRIRYAEAYLDAGHGACYLRDPKIARMVENAMLFFDGERYRLLEWSVMPNHVHVILEPLAGHTLADISHSWKSYTSHEANRMLNRRGSFWWREYFDRYIRDESHLANAGRYLEQKNPSPFSSAARRKRANGPAPAEPRPA
jgi:REP element-mobilizing transposase RayT